MQHIKYQNVVICFFLLCFGRGFFSSSIFDFVCLLSVCCDVLFVSLLFQCISVGPSCIFSSSLFALSSPVSLSLRVHVCVQQFCHLRLFIHLIPIFPRVRTILEPFFSANSPNAIRNCSVQKQTPTLFYHNKLFNYWRQMAGMNVYPNDTTGKRPTTRSTHTFRPQLKLLFSVIG